MLRRFVAVILSLSILALASGALEYLHDQQHAREDAILAAMSAPPAPGHDRPHPLHDENNCPVHAQLHLPMIPAAWVPLLVFLGLLVAFLAMPASRPVTRLAFAHIDCRGPPPAR